MTQRQARRWYLRARRAFPSLPPWSRVRIRFGRLRRELANVSYDKRHGRVTRARVVIAPDFRGAGWRPKLAFRELAHELAHVVQPPLEHGPAFERRAVRLKVAMESDPDWY